jgi:predicted amidohydrolase YtcJ
MHPRTDRDPHVSNTTSAISTKGGSLITECSAASAAREGDQVFDAGGGTVLPGLIDAHVHLVPGALAQSLTFGVTTVLDMFSKPDLVARAKERAGSRPDVADVRSSGVGATAPGGHPSKRWSLPRTNGA